MKLKFLGIYSAISLLFAGDIFAATENSERNRRLAELKRQTKNVNVSSRRDMWENRIKKPQSPSADQTENREKTRRLAELKRQTKEVDLKSRREIWENRIKDAQNEPRNRIVKKEKIETESYDDSKNEENEENVLRKDSLTDSQTTLVSEDVDAEQWGGSDLYKTDSQTTLVSEDVDTEQWVGSDFNKFAENLKSKFSESKRTQNELEQKVEDFSDNLKDSEISLEQQQKAESLKKDILDWNNRIIEQIMNFKMIQKDFDGLEMDKKIKQLNDYHVKLRNMSTNMTRKISQIQTNRRKEEKLQKKEKKRQVEQAVGSIDWPAIKKYNEEDLSKFVQAIQNYKLRFSVVQKYGKKCFDDQDASALFDPNLKMDPSLRGLCKQISQVRFPEAIEVWSKIKEMKENDPDYAATLDKLRGKIRALGKNVSSLIKQGYKESDSSPNTQD